MKPLYLHGTEPLTVSLDGSALRVVQSGSAIQRFPLERISRVMVSGAVSWSTDALLTCADEGISVCFLTNEGTPRARWFGRATDRNGFTQRWHDFIDRPDWPERYRQWRLATDRRAVRFCAWRMGWSPRNTACSMIHVIDQATGGANDAAVLRTAKRRIRGIAEARAMQELGKYGLAAEDAGILQLVPCLVSVIQWALLPDLVRLLGRQRHRRNRNRNKPVTDRRTIANFFEQHSAPVSFHLRDTFGRLYRYLEALQ